MTAEEMFCDLYDKYGDAFHWRMLPFSDKTFVEELKKEIGITHFLSKKRVWAVAKCDSNDDVLYLSDKKKDGKEVYYIFHLTWQTFNKNSPPRYKEIIGIEAVKEYIENLYITEYM